MGFVAVFEITSKIYAQFFKTGFMVYPKLLITSVKCWLSAFTSLWKNFLNLGKYPLYMSFIAIFEITSKIKELIFELIN